jgi:hypothetical protein
MDAKQAALCAAHSGLLWGTSALGGVGNGIRRQPITRLWERACLLTSPLPGYSDSIPMRQRILEMSHRPLPTSVLLLLLLGLPRIADGLYRMIRVA